MLDLWKVLAGITIFILGMNFLETALHALSGRKFKLFLRKQTARPLPAIGGGAIATGILQSSSLVSLIVLAMVGAGTLPMRNALAVILGSNVGTTLSSWIFALIGFNFNIEALALPAIAIAGIMRVVVKGKDNAYNFFSFLLGIGFLFLGLEMTKTGMEDAIKVFDIASLREYPAIIYLIAGFIITSLIQSSSATVVIALSALHTNSITLYGAAAIVLGAEIGTTIKLLIASVGKEPSMKRVAWGNFIFNITGSLAVFLLLRHILDLITGYFSIADQLIALAFFQTFVNVLSIVLFYPFLNLIARFLEKRFVSNHKVTKFISKMPVTDVDVAITAMRNESRYYLQMVMQYSADVFEADGPQLFAEDFPEQYLKGHISEKYDLIKQLHGDIYTYYISAQDLQHSRGQSKELDRLMSAVRNGMYVAKSMKDAAPDIMQLKNSGNEIKYNFYKSSLQKAFELLPGMAALLTRDNPESVFEDLAAVQKSVQESYTTTLQELYAQPVKLSEIEISTIINFNREMYTAYKSLIFSFKDLLLNEEEAKYFDVLPGFIR